MISACSFKFSYYDKLRAIFRLDPSKEQQILHQLWSHKHKQLQIDNHIIMPSVQCKNFAESIPALEIQKLIRFQIKKEAATFWRK